MREKPTRSDATEDTPEYLAEWAANLSEAVSRDEMVQLARDYERSARDSSLPEGARRFARRRARAVRAVL
jgi:hypothetical protein